MKTNRKKYSQNSGFKVPENYFGSFEEKMMRKLEDENSIEFKNQKSGFITPEGYFNGIEETILAKAQAEKPRVINIARKEYLFYAAAVAAILVMLLGNFFDRGINDPLEWDDVEVSALENYIDEGYDMGYIELNTSDYSDFILTGNQLVNDEDFNAVNSEAVFEYIDENIEDPTFILE